MRTKGLYIHLRKEGGKEMRIPDTGLVRSGYKKKLTTALGLYNTHSPLPHPNTQGREDEASAGQRL